jgi:hypothetical protein
MLTWIERKHLRDLCSRFEVDTQEIDGSLTYYENKTHLITIAHAVDREGLAEREIDRYEAFVKAQRDGGIYNVGAKCPVCRGRGSGLHLKWVLNEQKRRYYPYYYMAHSIKDDRGYRVKWCYMRKALAFEVMSDPTRLAELRLRELA